MCGGGGSSSIHKYTKFKVSNPGTNVFKSKRSGKPTKFSDFFTGFISVPQSVRGELRFDHGCSIHAWNDHDLFDEFIPHNGDELTDIASRVNIHCTTLHVFLTLNSTYFYLLLQGLIVPSYSLIMIFLLTWVLIKCY